MLVCLHCSRCLSFQMSMQCSEWRSATESVVEGSVQPDTDEKVLQTRFCPSLQALVFWHTDKWATTDSSRRIQRLDGTQNKLQRSQVRQVCQNIVLNFTCCFPKKPHSDLFPNANIWHSASLWEHRVKPAELCIVLMSFTNTYLRHLQRAIYILFTCIPLKVVFHYLRS